MLGLIEKRESLENNERERELMVGWILTTKQVIFFMSISFILREEFHFKY